MARKRRGQNDAQPAIFVAATPDTDFFGLGSIPFPNSFKLGTSNKRLPGVLLQGSLSAVWPPPRPGTSRESPPCAPQPQQKLDKTPPPTSSQPILTIAMTNGPLHLPCQRAAHPHRRPRDIRNTEPRARASLSVLTSSSHKIQPQAINSRRNLNRNLVLLSDMSVSGGD